MEVAGVHRNYSCQPPGPGLAELGVPGGSAVIEGSDNQDNQQQCPPNSPHHQLQ